MHVNINGKVVAVILEDDLQQTVDEVCNSNPYPESTPEHHAWNECAKLMAEKVSG
jgi:hypothetical protein